MSVPPNQAQNQPTPGHSFLSNLVDSVVNHPQVRQVVKALNTFSGPTGSLGILGLGAMPAIAISKAIQEQLNAYLGTQPQPVEKPQYYSFRERPDPSITKPYTGLTGSTIPAKLARGKQQIFHPVKGAPYGGPGVYRMFRGAPPESRAGHFTGGEGMFVTADPKYANRYATGEMQADEPSVLNQYWIPVKNALNLDNPELRNRYVRLVRQYGTEDERKAVMQYHLSGDIKGTNPIIIPQILSPQLIKGLRAAGFDAIYSSHELEGDYPTMIYLNPDQAVRDTSAHSITSQPSRTTNLEPAKPTSKQSQKYTEQAAKFFGKTVPSR